MMIKESNYLELVFMQKHQKWVYCDFEYLSIDICGNKIYISENILILDIGLFNTSLHQ